MLFLILLKKKTFELDESTLISTTIDQRECLAALSVCVRERERALVCVHLCVFPQAPAQAVLLPDETLHRDTNGRVRGTTRQSDAVLVHFALARECVRVCVL